MASWTSHLIGAFKSSFQIIWNLITFKNPTKDPYDVKVMNELNIKVNNPDLFQDHLLEANMQDKEVLDDE